MEKERTTKKRYKKNRKKIALFIVIVVIVAAAAVLLVVNPFHWNLGFGGSTPDGDAQATQTPALTGEIPTPMPTESVPSVVSAPPSASASGGSQSSPAPSDIPEADAAVYEDAQSHIGAYVTINGTAVKDATYNEGMLELVVMADEGQYASVTMLDEDQKYDLKAGDKVEVTGIVTAQVELTDANDLIHQGPMIAALEISS